MWALKCLFKLIWKSHHQRNGCIKFFTRSARTSFHSHLSEHILTWHAPSNWGYIRESFSNLSDCFNVYKSSRGSILNYESGVADGASSHLETCPKVHFKWKRILKHYMLSVRVKVKNCVFYNPRNGTKHCGDILHWFMLGFNWKGKSGHTYRDEHVPYVIHCFSSSAFWWPFTRWVYILVCPMNCNYAANWPLIVYTSERTHHFKATYLCTEGRKTPLALTPTTMEHSMCY